MAALKSAKKVIRRFVKVWQASVAEVGKCPGPAGAQDTAVDVGGGA